MVRPEKQNFYTSPADPHDVAVKTRRPHRNRRAAGAIALTTALIAGPAITAADYNGGSSGGSPNAPKSVLNSLALCIDRVQGCSRKSSLLPKPDPVLDCRQSVSQTSKKRSVVFDGGQSDDSQWMGEVEVRTDTVPSENVWVAAQFLKDTSPLTAVADGRGPLPQGRPITPASYHIYNPDETIGGAGYPIDHGFVALRTGPQPDQVRVFCGNVDGKSQSVSIQYGPMQ